MSRFKATPVPPRLPPPMPPASRATLPRALAPAPPPATGPRLATAPNPIRGIGFFFVAGYVGTLFGFLNELLIIAFHLVLPLAYLFGIPSLLAALLGGRLRSIFRTRIGYLVAGLCLFVTASVPFSIVRSASLLQLKNVLTTQYSIFFLIAALAITLGHVRTLMHILAITAIVDVLFTFHLGTQVGGRLAFAAGSLGNANDFALHLLVALPFCLLYVFEERRPLILKAAMTLASGVMVYFALQSGSRAATLCLLIVGAFGVWHASFVQRVGIAVFTIAGLVALPTLAPQTWTRLAPMFDSSAVHGSATAESAHESSQARLDLLRRSIEVTIQHPLFGAGIGEFADAEAGIAANEGVHAHWQVTHNAYTQISSECGIPAAICFAGIVFGSIRLSLGLYRRSRLSPLLAPTAQMALHLAFAIVCLAVGMLFDALAYNYYVPMLAGLSVALWNASQDDLRAAGV